MEDLWREAFSIGTEWEAMAGVYQNKNWDFSNLENAFKEGGDLHNQTVYLFGCTETQGIANPSLVPIVVAVVSRFPPSEKIGIASVQRNKEEILPMNQLKMDWIPYIPLPLRASKKVENLKSKVFILRCKQRKVSLKHLKFDKLTLYNYCLPYFNNPFEKDEFEEETEVDFMFPRDPLPPLQCSFDWEMDDLDEFAEEMVKNGDLSADQKGVFEDFVKEQVEEAKKKRREEREAKAREVEEMGEERSDAIRDMKVYKFYPVMAPGGTELLKCRNINRYYGKAHKVL